MASSASPVAQPLLFVMLRSGAICGGMWRGIARNSIGIFVHHGFVSGIITMLGPPNVMFVGL